MGERKRVGKGVYWSVRVALNTESKPDVVFISDGHEAPPLDPVEPVSMPDDVPARADSWLGGGAGSDTPAPIPKTDEDDRRIGFWESPRRHSARLSRWHSCRECRASLFAARAALARPGRARRVWLHAAFRPGFDPFRHARPEVRPPIAAAPTTCTGFRSRAALRC